MCVVVVVVVVDGGKNFKITDRAKIAKSNCFIALRNLKYCVAVSWRLLKLFIGMKDLESLWNLMWTT